MIRTSRPFRIKENSTESIIIQVLHNFDKDSTHYLSRDYFDPYETSRNCLSIVKLLLVLIISFRWVKFWCYGPLMELTIIPILGCWTTFSISLSVSLTNCVTLHFFFIFQVRRTQVQNSQADSLAILAFCLLFFLNHY